ncbi:UNVERIFIED_CONTAM: hypothetical protein FKN15_044678 [Acipenser sinensis]
MFTHLTLVNQASKIQKRLQILLGEHAAEHCSNQIGGLVDHHLRSKAFHSSAGTGPTCSPLVNSSFDHSEVEQGPFKSNQNDSMPTRCTLEVQEFACSVKAVLSRVEETLDSDATGSSSDEEWDQELAPGKRNLPVNHTCEWRWLSERAEIGSRWTWLQARISDLEYKIQQLSDLHTQIHSTKGRVILQDSQPLSDRLIQQMLLTETAGLLNTARDNTTPEEIEDFSLEHDFEMEPSSPTHLLRNIERQSAQLTEIVSSLIPPLSFSPSSSPVSSKPCSWKGQPKSNHTCEWRWLSERAEIGSRWTWLQARISDLEYKIQQLSDLHTQIHSTKGRVILQDSQPLSDRLIQQMLLTETAGLLNTARDNTTPEEIEDFSLEHDFEMEPSSPTHLLRNIERQSAQLTEIVSSLIPPLSFSPSSSPVSSKPCSWKGQPKSKVESTDVFSKRISCVSGQHSIKKRRVSKRKRRVPLINSTCVSARTRPLRTYQKRRLFTLDSQKEDWLNRPIPPTEDVKPPVFTSGGNEMPAFTTLIDEAFLSKLMKPPFYLPPYPEDGASDIMTSKSTLSHKQPTQNSARRRLQSECFYDIDNIVIPMSLAASSKVEKLQYKDIITPRAEKHGGREVFPFQFPNQKTKAFKKSSRNG